MLRLVRCNWCKIFFCVCRRCWRGQTYCCQECRRAAGSHAHREAQRRYRQTQKGRSAHRKAERKRRMRSGKKIMADRGSTERAGKCKMPSLTNRSARGPLPLLKGGKVGRYGRCHFCGFRGVIVNRFPRRGYARGNSSKGG